ncbi:LOW QUALITY PROTEIN: hypothetical protein U9M48_001250 [Paspalum notatum var. saurae]|uniref:Retrotransposon gag domain-containing protein n=1 Tax=Paspalum notatum var. saurae TaxID=547442 RepID=A0AAQ3SI29_PASNO
MGEFLRLKPPSFSGSQDPMEAEDWIRTMERKLELLDCDEQTKIALTTHQLWCCPSLVVKDAHKNGITWEEFTKAFRKHHVPEATKDLKAEEFRHLTQGNSTMTEYIQKFTKLSRYAPGEVDTDGKKCKAFIRGLAPKIATLAYTCGASDFASLISRTIRIEKLKQEEKGHLKRKFMEFKSQHQERRQKHFTGQLS